METGNTYVGGGPCVEDGGSGTKTGDAQVGWWPRAGAGAGAMLGLELGASGGDDGDRSVERG